MNKFVLLFCAIFINCYGQVEHNLLLQAPGYVDAEKHIQALQNKTYVMTWCLHNKVWKSCMYHQGKYALSVCYRQLPDSFTQEEKSLFKHVIKNDKDYFVYHFDQDGIVVDGMINYEEEIYDQSRATYYVAMPRIIIDACPEKISYQQLQEIVTKQRILFYTGAGISIAADIFSMNELMQQLDLQKDQEVDGFVQRILHEPLKNIEVIRIFFESMVHKKSTAAHYAIKKLAISLPAALMTENCDSLHEKTEIAPLRVSPHFFKQNIPDNSAQQIDAVICCGLSHDDRGFLAWYKQHNPQGRIIAIDIQQPSYLDDSDGIFYGDVQQILPQLHE